MSMEYIRAHYGVPAKRGARIRYTGTGEPQDGTIVGSDGPYIVVRLDGETRTGKMHPEWKVEYLDAQTDAGVEVDR